METPFQVTITADKPPTCQRDSCKAKTDAGDLQWIESRKSVRPGMWTAEPVQATLTIQAQQSDVRQLVNAAQRGDNHVVKAIGMPPPPLPSQAAAQRALLGPNVVSSLMSNPHGIYISPHDQAPLLPVKPGYTEAHQHFEALKAHFRKKASVAGSAGAEVIPILVTLVYLIPNRKSPKQIHTIKEAMEDVPVHIGAQELKQLAFSLILPQFIKWCPGFNLSIEDCILRKASASGLGVEISPPPPFLGVPNPIDIDAISAPYFKTKSSRKVFVHTSKALALHLVISDETFQTILNHQDELEAAKMPPPRNYQNTKLDSLMEEVLNVKKRKNPPSPKKPKIPSSRPKITSKETQDVPPLSPPPSQNNDSMAVNQSLSNNVPNIKKSLADPFRTTSGLTASQYKSSATSIPASVRIDVAQLQAAIAAQSGLTFKETRTILKSRTLDCRIYCPPSYTIHDLIKNGTSKIKLDILTFPSQHISLSYGAGKPLSGTFKTAWSGTSSTPLFGRSSHEVCVKQAHILDPIDKVNKIVSGPSQLDSLAVELNCLLWGSALMNLVFAFLAEKDIELGAPPFPIPQMHFVSAGIAISEAEPKQVFLVEEQIDTVQESGGKTWVKYLNNDSVLPREFNDPGRTYRSLFLCFSQHVQHELTGGNVFVSDYQGGELALTDPQIITSPDLVGTVPIFSGGNLNFSMLEEKHRCNQFCKHYGLKAFIKDTPTPTTTRLFLPKLSTESTEQEMPQIIMPGTSCPTNIDSTQR
ncbi:hypothetical protein H0H93_012690 [Arthromyces matolae]|nr:hypothetical protein H0H93_012690 [Arthromyces matolae]